MALDKNLFRNWIDGDTFSARDYVYERDLIIDFVNALPSIDNVLEDVAEEYYSKTQLDGGQLDNLYYTKTQLLTNGVLDARYYTEGEVNGLFVTERNRLNRLESKFSGTILAQNDQLFNQAVNTTSNVQFNQVTTPTAIVNGVNVGTTLANKSDIGHTHTVSQITDLQANYYTESEVDTLLTAKVGTNVLGQPNGVATLGSDGKLAAEQLPLDVVVFKGTFGDGVGDLPATGAVTGDFYICVSNGYVSVVAGKTFDIGDKAVYDGTNWSKIDNTESVTSVTGSNQREGNPTIGAVELNYEDVGAAPLVHEHAWTDLTSGVPTTIAGYGITDAYTQTELNNGQLDNRYYTENELLNTGVLDSRYYTENELTNGQLDTRYYTETELNPAAAAGSNVLDARYYTETELTNGQLDSRYYTETELNNGQLDNRYYTETELNNGQLDNRYYTETEVNDALALKVDTSAVGTTIATLVDGKVPTSQLPSYVDGLDEFADLASFPPTGIINRIYVALDTGKTYRWGGSAYAEISPSEVNSVNNYTGHVTLTDGDIGVDAAVFDGVLTTDATNVELALLELDAHTHAYSEITNKPLLYTQAEVDAFLAEKADVADLSATITLYPTTTPSAVSGYFTMVTDITDDRYNDVAFDVGTGAIDQQDQLIASLATDANIFTGNPGVINVNTIGNIRKTAGNTNAFANFYFKLFKRDASGTETLLGTSDTTAVVNPETLDVYEEFSASAVLNNGSFLATDRLVIKYYANAIEGTTAQYDFQFGGANPVRTFLPVPVRVLQSAEKIVYDNSVSGLTATNLQDAIDEIDNLIEQNTSVIKIQRFVITNADNGDNTFSYTWDGNARTGVLDNGEYQFTLEDNTEYIVGQNRFEIKVNNDLSFFPQDLEVLEINATTVGLTYALQVNDEVFIKVYQGLDSVALEVQDGTITNAKLSVALQNELDTYENHIANTSIHFLKTDVNKSDVGLGNLTNDTQMKKIASSTNGNVPIWNGTTGDVLSDGYGVQTTLSSSANHLVRADAIQTAVNSLSSLIDTKQATLVSGTNIKTINGTSLLGSGNYEIDIPSVDVQATPPDLETSNNGDLWWNTNNAVLYISYDDGTSKQWVEVSYAAVQEAINALIASAPGTLDTLNEIAAALNDDPDFYNTITGLINQKADTSLVNTKADKLASFTTISADHTLELVDAHKVLRCTNSIPIDIEIPLHNEISIPVGTTITVLKNGTGTVTIAPITGVTINSPDPVLTTRYNKAELLKLEENVWQVNIIAESQDFAVIVEPGVTTLVGPQSLMTDVYSLSPLTQNSTSSYTAHNQETIKYGSVDSSIFQNDPPWTLSVTSPTGTYNWLNFTYDGQTIPYLQAEIGGGSGIEAWVLPPLSGDKLDHKFLIMYVLFGNEGQFEHNIVYADASSATPILAGSSGEHDIEILETIIDPQFPGGVARIYGVIKNSTNEYLNAYLSSEGSPSPVTVNSFALTSFSSSVLSAIPLAMIDLTELGYTGPVSNSLVDANSQYGAAVTYYNNNLDSTKLAIPYVGSSSFVSNWTGSGPFTQTVSVPGISSSDTPIADIDLSNVTYANVEATEGDWAKIYRVETLDDEITLYAKEATTVNLPVRLKVVK